MRSVVIPIHDGRPIELFIERQKNYFELWLVSAVRGHRMVLDHHLTHDDLEKRLEYAEARDLIWRDASHSNIPTEMHRNAVEMEQTIDAGTFWDFERPHQSVTCHLGALSLLPMDKAYQNAAKKAILGRWTDGVVTMTIDPDNRLRWSCTDNQHPLNVGERVHGHAPDWWNFSKCRLYLMNSAHKCGTHTGVLRVDTLELHIDGDQPHRMAHVFRRDRLAEREVDDVASSGETSPISRRRNMRSPVAGQATDSLSRLEEAIVRRNPLLAGQLKAGLLECDIREALDRGNVSGAIEPLIDLYSWRNGTISLERTPIEETSLFPVDNYQFLDLEAAINHYQCMNRAARQLQRLFQGTKTHNMFCDLGSQVFPLFRDGGTGAIAVDLTSSTKHRVMFVEFEACEPVRQAYSSFQDFIHDAIRANKEGSSLACFQ